VVIAEHAPRAVIEQQLVPQGHEVKAEAVHVRVREGDAEAAEWLRLRSHATLSLPGGPLHVEYRPDRRELPVSIKLLDFRKIDYPGTQMAAGFESDVQMTDAARGVILMRKISMNQPLRYRGYHFYQSSFVDGPTQTTVLSVRNDPGTWMVYSGFVIVIAGVISLFVTRRAGAAPRARPRHAAQRRNS
jgi:cytochrome c biogenesis protein ResB